MERNLTMKAAAPYRKTLSTTTKSGEIFPRKRVFFRVSSEHRKTPEEASGNSVMSLNLFGVANQMWSVSALQHSRPYLNKLSQ